VHVTLETFYEINCRCERFRVGSIEEAAQFHGHASCLKCGNPYRAKLIVRQSEPISLAMERNIFNRQPNPQKPPSASPKP
jgi:hypothetical protein